MYFEYIMSRPFIIEFWLVNVYKSAMQKGAVVFLFAILNLWNNSTGIVLIKFENIFTTKFKITWFIIISRSFQTILLCEWLPLEKWPPTRRLLTTKYLEFYAPKADTAKMKLTGFGWIVDSEGTSTLSYYL